MSISMRPSFHGGKDNLNQIFSLYYNPDSDFFYQKTEISFFILLLNVHFGFKEESTYSIFTPESQYNGPISSIAGRTSNMLHQHNTFEFTYVVSGGMYQLVEGKRFFYPTGSCCLMNRNTLHTEDVSSSDFTCIFFSVSSEFVQLLDQQAQSLLFPQEKKRFDNLIFHFMKDNSEKEHKGSKDFLDFVPRITEDEQKVMVHDIFESMLYTLLNPYYGATYRLQDLFFQLIDILCNPTYYIATHVTAQSSMDSLLFSRIDQLLKERNGRISNKELSLLLNYDGSYLGRIVKKHTGKSLFDYSMTFTMAAAKEMLSRTKKSVSEIADELHFSNRTHFYKLFEQNCGMTPRQYRKMNVKE